MKKLLLVIAIAYLLTTLFFILDEFNLMVEYNVTYLEIIEKRGILGTITLFFRYILAYPLSGIIILLYLFKKEEKGI